MMRFALLLALLPAAAFGQGQVALMDRRSGEPPVVVGTFENQQACEAERERRRREFRDRADAFYRQTRELAADVLEHMEDLPFTRQAIAELRAQALLPPAEKERLRRLLRNERQMTGTIEYRTNLKVEADVEYGRMRLWVQATACVPR